VKGFVAAEATGNKALKRHL